MSEFVAGGETQAASTAKTPSEAVREYYKDELAAGTLSEADLAKLQAIAEEKAGDFRDWAQHAGEALKPAADEFITTVKEHGEGLKQADADGVLSGQEFVKDGLPIIDGLIDFSDAVDGEVHEGINIILDGSHDIIEARGEMDGADPAVTEAKLAEIEDAHIRVDDYMDWRHQQTEQARDAIHAHREEIEAIPDIHQLPVHEHSYQDDPNAGAHDQTVEA